jgi:two-component system C4-dicarboxylate transport response regulator DctD
MSSAISNGQVIIIDDEQIDRESMIQTLQLEGYNASAYEKPQRAIEQ